MMNTFSAHIMETPWKMPWSRNGRGDEEICSGMNLDRVLEDVEDYMKNYKENTCDQGIILANLRYFSPIPVFRRRDIPFTHYIKSKTPGKCAELRIFPTMIEFNTRMSTFVHGDIQQMMNITDELESLLKKVTMVLEEIEGYESILDDYSKGSKERIFVEEELVMMDQKKQEIAVKVKELRETMKGFGFQ
ncbi:unnamed protein product [Caenorhabditis brenneri]